MSTSVPHVPDTTLVPMNAGARPNRDGARHPVTRTVAKAVTWQGVGLVTSTAIAFALTGSLATGGLFALLSAGLGTVLFVVHERVWDAFG